MRPDVWIDGCAASQRALEARLSGLTDAVARGPSGLAGWSVGHLVTHLARNADAHEWVVDQAGRGEVVAMYPLGPQQRDAAIEAGAGRPATELLADLGSAQVRLEAAWASADAELWRSGVGLRRAGPATVAEFVFLRWREVELHARDLGPDLWPGDGRWAELPAAYGDQEWVEMTRGLSARVPAGVTLVLAPDDGPAQAFGSGPRTEVVSADRGLILGWLTDRVVEPTWPALAGWGY